MPDFSDPNQVHELLAMLLVMVLLTTAVVAILYLNALNRFFAELERKEPEIWNSIGSPNMKGMLQKPHKRFYKSFAFLPVLRERAQRPARDYNHARRAYSLLKTGLALSALLAIIGSVIAGWIAYHGL